MATRTIQANGDVEYIGDGGMSFRDIKKALGTQRGVRLHPYSNTEIIISIATGPADTLLPNGTAENLILSEGRKVSGKYPICGPVLVIAKEDYTL
jgi:hypothetical protein